MTKRARGSSRPGQRRPLERRPAAGAGGPAATPAAPIRAGGLTDAEAARAAELEARLVADERAAEAVRRQTRERASLRESTPAGTLAQRAETEYAYVARDVREIVRIAILLLVVLVGLWLAIDVAALFPVA